MYQIKLSRSLHGMEAGREERREGERGVLVMELNRPDYNNTQLVTR